MPRRYALEFAPKALRALRKLDRPVVERIKARDGIAARRSKACGREDAHRNARSSADQGRR
jgi:mRNA-degrading endonuclease RelE of RelBE toxin-antitoxin system